MVLQSERRRWRGRPDPAMGTDFLRQEERQIATPTAQIQHTITHLRPAPQA